MLGALSLRLAEESCAKSPVLLCFAAIDLHDTNVLDRSQLFGGTAVSHKSLAAMVSKMAAEVYIFSGHCHFHFPRRILVG